MARLSVRPSVRRLVSLSVVLTLSCLASSRIVRAQGTAAISGLVVDESGGALVGAHVTVSDAKGTVVVTTTSDGDGAFTLRTLPFGTYVVVVELKLFRPDAQSLTIPTPESDGSLRAVLRPGGFVDGVVVTASRAATRIAETPQKVEVIDSADIERSVAADIADVLKKNSGVDVIQYTGALAGIGIRGFRPQISGINKRSLLLINGRPSGVTNLAALLADNVERIEVLKGAASAVYGSSAMGGVVNVITRQSLGKIGGNARIGGGSFGTSDLSGRVGGSASSRIDFDATGSMFDQRDDIRMGNGVTRPATSYTTYDTTGRIGVALFGDWRVDSQTEAYRGRDIETPPDIVAGTIGQGSKNIERNSSDVRVSGHAGTHDLSMTTYRATESSHTTNVTTSNPLDLPFLPFLSFESELGWVGVQARDSVSWFRLHTLVLGVDYEAVTSVSRSYTRTGDQSAPFSANAEKRTTGVYAENNFRLRDGGTMVTLGGRVDRITTATLVTPLKTNFTPSETTFWVFNPSFGVKQQLGKGLRAHFTAGRAFIPAEASMLTGYTTTVVGGRTQISQGNPDLQPERSTSFDVGVELHSSNTRFDVTAFRTVVKDRFISNVVISNPDPPDPIIVSIANGLDAHISGMDVEAEQRAGRHLGFFANVTHYLDREERLVSGAEQDILNVPLNTIRAGLDVDLARLSARLSGRYVQGRKDNDFNAPGFPIVDYENFTVFDLTASYRLAQQHSILLGLNNIGDAFYYEKLGYPLQGASFKLSYRFGF